MDLPMDMLVAECQRLQLTLAPAGQTVRHFIAAYPDAKVQLSPLLEELLGLPNVVLKLERDVGEGAGENGLLHMIRGVPDVCIENIRQIESVLSEPSRHGRDALRTLAEQATALASFLVIGRRALNLAVTALELVNNLRRAERNGESPPYEASSILHEITAIQNLLNEQTSSQQNARLLRQLHGPNGSSVSIQQLHNITIGGFLDLLKSFCEQQSGTTSTLEVARISVAGSSTSIPPPNISPHSEVDARYLAPNLLPAAPSAVNFKHIGKVVMNLEKEPQDIKFMPGNPAIFAVSNFHKDVALFDANTGQRKKELKGVKGVQLVVSPSSDVMALTVEHPDESLLKQKPIPLSHDFVHFQKPALYVFDTPRGPAPATRRFFLQWHDIRAFSFSPDGSLLAVKGVKNRVEIIHSAKGSGYGVVRSHTDEVTHAEVTADGERIVTMSRDGTLRVTHVQSLRSIAKLEMDNWRNPLQLAVSTVGIIASIWGRTVTIWDYDTGVMDSYNFDTARGSEGWPLAISPDLRWVASRTDDGADVTDLATGKVMYSARLETGFVSSATFSHDGKYLVFGRCMNGHHGKPDSGVLNVWEIQA